LFGEVITYSILSVLGIMAHIAGRKLKPIEIFFFSLFSNCTALLLFLDMTCYSHSASLHMLGLPLQQTGIHLRGEEEEGE